MEEVEVDLLDAQTAEAPIARRGHALACGVLGIELRHHEYLIAASLDRLADNPLRASVGVHLGGVDEPHAELDAGAQSGDLVLSLALAFAHPPCALPEDGHGVSARKRRGRNARHASEIEHELCRPRGDAASS